ncbi:MAG: glycosyltransferase family 4 protein, partial [Acidobacteriota bacterium]|nr:glycosyltransferase family 4 protein [Acidobacteriota bacterium]
MRRRRLAIFTTHPIQYQVPWFRALALHSDLDLDVFFGHQATPREQATAGFGVEFDWDIPLLEGYQYRFLNNVAKEPRLSKFAGIDTPEIGNIIEREHYDAWLICGWHFKGAWQAIRACWRTKTPVMVRGDSHLHTPRHYLKKVLKRPFYRWFIPKFDACLAVGKWSKEYYLYYGASPTRIFLVPHVVDDNYFASESARLLPHRQELRKYWGLEDESVVFLFVGKFIDKKRPMDFVKAIARAAIDDGRVVGLMVGDGPLRTQCEEFVRYNNLPIRFAGFLNQSQMIRSYVAADVLVLPSDGGETWGLVVNEAMSCGRPCILSDQVGSGPDMIDLGKAGTIYPMGDTAALAILLTSYAENQLSLKKMSLSAQERARQNSVDVAVRGVMEAL